MMLIGESRKLTSIGESDCVSGSLPDEPMWIDTTTASSTHAFQKGAQWSPWKLGTPRFSGFSVNVTACTPFGANRRTSLAISSTSHDTGRPHGMNRPGYVPHHSSTFQSL